MEGLTRLVAESLARYGLDPPVDYRRLRWSRWFRCESLHSLLYVPSKPGVFALAEEVIGSNFSDSRDREGHDPRHRQDFREGHDFSRAVSAPPSVAALAAEVKPASGLEGLHGRRMLSVLQFCEDDDMAYVLDRMLSRQNPMNARLAAGRCFVRFVVIEDEVQRRNICSALNQWLMSSGEKASGIGAHFASSLDLPAVTDRVGAGDPVERTLPSANADSTAPPALKGWPERKPDVARTCPERESKGPSPATAGTPAPPAQTGRPEVKTDAPQTTPPGPAPHLDSGAAANIHCPQPLPSGF